MLPHEDLAPWYEKAVWLYVCRTWHEDEADLEAARIHDRFGVTSWPHLFLVDPADDRVLQRAGRTTQALDRAFTAAAAEVTALPEDEVAHVLDAVRAAAGAHPRVGGARPRGDARAGARGARATSTTPTCSCGTARSSY